MLNWLLQDWNVFGWHGQNWMFAFAVALALYIAGMIVAGRLKQRLRAR